MRACPTIQVLTQLRLHLGANMYFMNARPSHANCVRDYKRAHDELLPQLGAIRNLIPHTPVEIIGLSALVKHALGRIHMDNPFTQPWTFASFDSHIGGIAQGFWFNYPAGSFVDIAAFRHNVLHSFSPAVANAFAQVFYRNNVRQRFQRPRLSHPLLRDLLPQGYPENVLPFPIDMEDNVINQNNPHVGGGYYNEGDFDSISLVDSSPLEKSNDAFIYDNMSDEDKAAYLADKREKYANMPDEDKAAIVARARLTRVRTGGAKGPWTESEDKQLIKLVKEGYKTWVSLAVNVAGRTSEQCSNRWNHHLDPNINKAPFSEEEDKIVLDLRAKENGWAEIAKFLSNRTKESVQNRWKCMERMKKKKRKKEEKEEKEKEKEKRRKK